jgi:7-carboxy-7-deazaguanine synthase
MLSVFEIAAQVKDSKVNHVVLTGGEPMLFDAIESLATLLKDAGHTITIETAGTVFRQVNCDLMSISPKLANSTPQAETVWRARHEETRRKVDSLCRLLDRYEFQLKFVLTTKNEVDEVDELLSKLPPIPPDRIIIMAEGISSDVQHRRQRELVSLCIERGWRLTPRLHIDLFGNTKGT